jgi:hypothetical protein
MGKKSQSTTKKISRALGSDVDTSDLQKCFNQMTGSENPEIKIVLPKYNAIHDCIATLQESFIELKIDIVDKYYEDEDGAGGDLRKFINEMKDVISSKVDNVLFEAKDYLELKDNDIVQTLVITCSNLIPIVPHIIKEWADVDKKFFLRYPQISFTPLSFASKIDFKKLWIVDGDRDPKMMESLCSILRTIARNTHMIYKTVTSPDVDISKLSEIIVGALGSLKKQIPRCEKAFKKITDSVNLLENNFDSYYKDFVQSSDPMNIFTGFIGDVADTCDSDPQLIFQCRKIVNFYKKSMAKNVNNPNMTSEKTRMFDSLMKNYSHLEKTMGDENDLEDTDNVQTDPEDAIPAEVPDLDDVMNFINDTKLNNLLRT